MVYPDIKMDVWGYCLKKNEKNNFQNDSFWSGAIYLNKHSNFGFPQINQSVNLKR
ncbi:MAG: hypothetical protein CM15mV127_440 [Caudoviricetes sp.]|nr:MAG: hypothetical protein CM15mV127_440 [Caudoviricetes sp.]